jgi:hypothetical protein
VSCSLISQIKDIANRNRDIVDHTPFNGNLWKMILGAIDEDFDDDPDDSQTRWMADQYS